MSRATEIRDQIKVHPVYQTMLLMIPEEAHDAFMDFVVDKQLELEDHKVTTRVGAGMVELVCNLQGEVQEVTLDTVGRDLTQVADRQLFEDLIKSAVNQSIVDIKEQGTQVYSDLYVKIQQYVRALLDNNVPENLS